MSAITRRHASKHCYNVFLMLKCLVTQMSAVSRQRVPRLCTYHIYTIENVFETSMFAISGRCVLRHCYYIHKRRTYTVKAEYKHKFKELISPAKHA